jgi:hypothetical protein
LNPFLEGQEFFVGESIDRPKLGLKSGLEVDRVVILRVRG